MTSSDPIVKVLYPALHRCSRYHIHFDDRYCASYRSKEVAVAQGQKAGMRKQHTVKVIDSESGEVLYESYWVVGKA